MLFVNKIKISALLPVLIVLLILSIESIIVIILELIESSLILIESDFLLYSDEFRDIVKMVIAQGITILVIVIISTQRLISNEIKPSSEIKLRTFIILISLFYVGCISFLITNLRNSLFIYSEKASTIEIWSKFIISQAFIDHIDYHLFLILLLLVVSPIFEELERIN